MTDKKELKVEELAKVSGGYICTYMHCSSCGHSVMWDGGEHEGKTYDCPDCKNHTLVGLYTEDYKPVRMK